MNILFFGSSRFAVHSLKALLSSEHKISCVVTQPDRAKGRGLRLGATEIKKVALEAGLRVYQPPNINLADAIKFLNNFNAELFIVIAYGQILSREVLAIPKILPINIHASLLPKYRGAAPINWALIKGEKKTGVTLIKMTQDLDAGPVIFQRSIDIAETDTAITLEDKLSKLAAELILESLTAIKQNNYRLTPQNKKEATFAPELKKEDGGIGWNKPASDIYNLIRGCTPWPGAFTYYKGKILKVHKAEIIRLPDSEDRQSAEVIEVSKEGIFVATGDGGLLIKELQIEGKRRMKAEEFIAGHKILPGEIFKKIVA